MVSGANTAVNSMLAASTQMISAAVAVPIISPRSTVTRCEIGFTSTNERSHDGIVVVATMHCWRRSVETGPSAR